MKTTLATGRCDGERLRVGFSMDRQAAFTLVEVVIVLTVVGILAGIAVPTINGVVREREAREPVAELVRLARTVRQRAIREQVPYQIAFDGQGFHAARFFNPYGEAEEFAQVLRDMEALEQRRKLIEASQDRIGALADFDEAENFDNFQSQPTSGGAVEDGSSIYYETYEMPEGTDYELLFWGQTEWMPMQSGRFERWVFQPSGMCKPIKIRVSSEGAFFEVEFHPLTGDVKSERGWVE